MSADRIDNQGGIPSPWGQRFPRAVRLAPGHLLVPAKTLRALLERSGRLTLAYTGFCMAPTLVNNGDFSVRTGLPRPGQLALVDVDGWGDVRRVLAIMPDGHLRTALDSYPRGLEVLQPRQVLGVVCRSRRRLDAALARAFPAWSRWTALMYWFRKILEAPDFGVSGGCSIEEKYQWQVESYETILRAPLSGPLLRLLARELPRGADLLVPGCGVGREALHLAREGYQVAAFDLIPGMIEAARKHASAAGLGADFFVSDMAALELGTRRFDGVFVTPLVYSFVQGRERRVAALRRLGHHLKPGGKVIFSAHLIRTFEQWLRVTLAWARHRARGERGSERGDWFTWFLTPRGTIGKAYSHRFTTGRVKAEAAQAGFRAVRLESEMMHFVAGDFRE